MTHLRKIMLEELERRNYAQTTTNVYLQTVEDFARYFKRPPDQIRLVLTDVLRTEQRQSNPIARGFLQVAVSKAPAQSNEIQDSS